MKALYWRKDGEVGVNLVDLEIKGYDLAVKMEITRDIYDFIIQGSIDDVKYHISDVLQTNG